MISVREAENTWRKVVVHHARPCPVDMDKPNRLYYRIRTGRRAALRHTFVVPDGRIVLLPAGHLNTSMPVRPPKMGFWALHWWDSSSAGKIVVSRWLQYGELIPHTELAP
jgi:hypothetical protein